MLFATGAGLNPLAGLGMIPFTLLPSLAILLPVYLWCRDVKRLGAAQSYSAVIGAGVIGGILIMALLAIGASPYSGWLSVASLKYHGLGAGLGGGCGLSWVAAHHVSRSRRSSRIDG